MYYRVGSPDVWRAGRTAEMIENEFGMNPSDIRPRPSGTPKAVVGKRMEERIRRRAETDARGETGEFRAVRILHCKTMIMRH